MTKNNLARRALAALLLAKTPVERITAKFAALGVLGTLDEEELRRILEGTPEPDSVTDTNASEDAGFLRSLAQNDYMIDTRYLPAGARLLAIAHRLKP